MPKKLEEFRDYLSGRADPETAERIAAELNDATSPLAIVVQGGGLVGSRLLGHRPIPTFKDRAFFVLRHVVYWTGSCTILFWLNGALAFDNVEWPIINIILVCLLALFLTTNYARQYKVTQGTLFEGVAGACLFFPYGTVIWSLVPWAFNTEIKVSVWFIGTLLAIAIGGLGVTFGFGMRPHIMQASWLKAFASASGRIILTGPFAAGAGALFCWFMAWVGSWSPELPPALLGPQDGALLGFTMLLGASMLACFHDDFSISWHAIPATIGSSIVGTFIGMFIWQIAGWEPIRGGLFIGIGMGWSALAANVVEAKDSAINESGWEARLELIVYVMTELFICGALFGGGLAWLYDGDAWVGALWGAGVLEVLFSHIYLGNKKPEISWSEVMANMRKELRLYNPFAEFVGHWTLVLILGFCVKHLGLPAPVGIRLGLLLFISFGISLHRDKSNLLIVNRLCAHVLIQAEAAVFLIRTFILAFRGFRSSIASGPL